MWHTSNRVLDNSTVNTTNITHLLHLDIFLKDTHLVSAFWYFVLVSIIIIEKQQKLISIARVQLVKAQTGSNNCNLLQRRKDMHACYSSPSGIIDVNNMFVL